MPALRDRRSPNCPTPAPRFTARPASHHPRPDPRGSGRPAAAPPEADPPSSGMAGRPPRRPRLDPWTPGLPARVPPDAGPPVRPAPMPLEAGPLVPESLHTSAVQDRSPGPWDRRPPLCPWPAPGMPGSRAALVRPPGQPAPAPPESGPRDGRRPQRPRPDRRVAGRPAP